MIRVIVALYLLTVVSFAEQEATTAKVDHVFAQFTKRGSPGCAVGVMRDGELIFAKGYGLANIEHEIPITKATVFELGSTSKQFTTAAVALLASEGKLTLEDDVRKYIPEMPDYGRTITVRHLLNHSSGIRDYLVLMALSGVSSEGITTDEDALRVITAQKALNFMPGDDHLCSNSGYFLLSKIVERAAGRSLREYAHEKLFEPLGMKATFFRNKHDEIVPRRATGYARSERSGFRIAMSGFEQTGDGAVHSTIEDLLAWDNNFYQRTVGGDRLWESLLERGKLNSGRQIDYALGLYHGKHRGLDLIHHGGSWAGYRAELIRFASKRLSVACLCNTVQGNPVQYARQVADVFLGVAEEQTRAAQPVGSAPVPPAVTPTAQDLAGFAGFYADVERGSFRKVSLINGRLEVETYGMGRYPLLPIGSNRFRLEGIPFQLDMTFDAESVHILRDSTPGEILRKQVEGGANSLDEYVGQYESAELRTRFSLEVDGPSLVVRPQSGSPRKLELMMKDNFIAPGVHVRFRRDANGRTTGFIINAGRVKGIEVSRASSCGGQ